MIADTVYSAAFEKPFISTMRSHPPHRRLRIPPHLALAANVWFKLEHGAVTTPTCDMRRRKADKSASLILNRRSRFPSF